MRTVKGLIQEPSGPVLTTSTPRDKPHECNEYLVSIALPHDQESTYHPAVLVIDTEFHPSEEIQARIGRDILRSLRLDYDGKGGTFALQL